MRRVQSEREAILRERAVIVSLTAAMLVGGATQVIAESWQLNRVCTPTDRCPIVRVEQGRATLFISEHPTRVECVFAGAEMVREKGWRMECRGAQRYDLYRVVLQKPKNLIETREKILVSSHETESECKTAAGGSAGFRVEDLTELGKSKSAISQLQCFAVDEFSRT